MVQGLDTAHENLLFGSCDNWSFLIQPFQQHFIGYSRDKTTSTVISLWKGLSFSHILDSVIQISQHLISLQQKYILEKFHLNPLQEMSGNCAYLWGGEEGRRYGMAFGNWPSVALFEILPVQPAMLQIWCCLLCVTCRNCLLLDTTTDACFCKSH